MAECLGVNGRGCSYEWAQPFVTSSQSGGCRKRSGRQTSLGPGSTSAEPVKWLADVTRATENIPIRRHRAETKLEELSVWSSFLTSSLCSTVQIEDQKLNGYHPAVRGALAAI
jgi:hypothetical protein